MTASSARTAGAGTRALPVADTDSFAGLVQVARTGAEMAERLRDAVGPATVGAADRVAFARQNSWDARARQYVTFVQGLVAPGNKHVSALAPGQPAV